MFKALIYAIAVQEAVKLYQGPQYVYYYTHRNQESFAQTWSVEEYPEMGKLSAFLFHQSQYQTNKSLFE